jgi:hypothetical protein
MMSSGRSSAHSSSAQGLKLAAVGVIACWSASATAFAPSPALPLGGRALPSALGLRTPTGTQPTMAVSPITGQRMSKFDAMRFKFGR